MRKLATVVVSLMILGMISFTFAAKNQNATNNDLILRHFPIDKTISYQGLLKNSSGDPVPDASYILTFRIYNRASGGTALWTSSSTSVTTASGYFTTQLDPVPLAFDTTYYLSLQVQSDPEMATRQKLTSSPYAVTADTSNYAFKADTARYALNGGNNYWTLSGSILSTSNYYGIAKGGAGNILLGDSTRTMINFGVACSTGANSGDIRYATVGGGYNNYATGSYCTIGGGTLNRARSVYGGVCSGYFNWAGYNPTDTCDFVGGGYNNYAIGSYSAIGGGYHNEANNNYCVIGGGFGNTANGDASVVAGGSRNAAFDYETTIGGGESNGASGAFSGVCSGYHNYAGEWPTDSCAYVGGGQYNSASAAYSAINGGYYNYAQGLFSEIGGGASDTVKAVYGGVSSGHLNIAGGASTDTGAFVGGGVGNSARTMYCTISGGQNNFDNGFYSTICGGINNYVHGDYGFVGGGFSNHAAWPYSAIAGGSYNYANGNYSTIGGGNLNRLSNDYTTIGGGYADTANNQYATISGGSHNVASGWGAMIPGGAENVAAGTYSFAAGLGAHANHNGCFIYGDDYPASSYLSDRDGQTKFKSRGGVKFDVNSLTSWVEIWNNGSGKLINTSTGAYLSTAGSWTNNSDRNLKENFTPIDGNELLGKISQLSITRWNYKSDDKSITHIGPMAQDFKRLFEVGNDSTTISSLDPAGVALAGVQELIKAINNLKKENAEIKAELARLKAEGK